MRYSMEAVLRRTTFSAPLPQPQPHRRMLHSSIDRVSMCMSSTSKHHSQLCVDRPVGVATTNNRIVHLPTPWPVEEEEDEDINSQKLDQWIRDSAVEIVKNIDEAPFLVHIYCSDGSGSGSGSRIKTVKEKAVADNWPMIEGRWKERSRVPSGVILVGQLYSIEDQNIDNDNSELCSSSSSSKLWGILIQGKRKSCTACYLLKTSRVQGVGGFCTHFCLSRVDCFLEQADILLKKLWLQMG